MEENSTWIVASALGIWAFDNGPTDLSKAKQRNSNSPQPKAKAKQQGGPNDSSPDTDRSVGARADVDGTLAMIDLPPNTSM